MVDFSKIKNARARQILGLDDFEGPGWRLILGDSLDVLRSFGDASVDAVVTDPPAGISFMSKAWDGFSTNLPQPDFLNWFAGFVDGEGCFSVHRKPQDTYDCQFSIALRADDRPILVEIQRILRIGTLSKPSAHRTGNGNPAARFSVSSKADCVRLVEVLRAAPLRAKKALDFETWCEALDEWVRHRPGEWSGMRDARERLMASRAYSELGKIAGPPERRAFIAAIKPIFSECLRVLKPGAHALVWALPRTSHWTATALEDAGFEVRDVITHHFGTGFPKSLDVGKAIDKAAGAEREVLGEGSASCEFIRRGEACPGHGDKGKRQSGPTIHAPATAPATPAAREWEGWGTALKPASEHWILARRPFVGTVAANVLKFGTGGLNVDSCRVGWDPVSLAKDRARREKPGHDIKGGRMHAANERGQTYGGEKKSPTGRWPPNLLLSHSPECEPAGTRRVKAATNKGGPAGASRNATMGEFSGKARAFDYADADGAEEVEAWRCAPGCPVAEMDRQSGRHGGAGGASRFFPRFRYAAKASTRERNLGLPEGVKSTHPTVKSVALMRWLCRLVTPPGGTVLDPFAGSGSTGVAALAEGFEFVGIEREGEYTEIAAARLKEAEGK